jgi:hypothetical protein
MSGGVAATAEKSVETPFASAEELREVLTALLEEIETDSDLGRRLGAAHVPYRYVFTDLGLSLDIADSEAEGKWIRWSFSDDADWEPKVTLKMDSGVANRFLQGRENLAIALARGRIKCSCEARAALSLLPMNRELNSCYRQVLERDFPHLLLD